MPHRTTGHSTVARAQAAAVADAGRAPRGACGGVVALLVAALAGVAQAAPPRAPEGGLYLGADLSYVNEMED